MGIDPVGCEFSPIVYTEHRVLDRPEVAPGVVDGEETGIVKTDDADGVPPSARPLPPAGMVDAAPATSDLFTPVNTAASPAEPVGVADGAPALVVEPGDTVIVRFDDNRIRRFRLSTDTNRPEDGVVHVSKPIGLALLGNGLEEEVEFVVDGKSKVVMIEKISKANQRISA